VVSTRLGRTDTSASVVRFTATPDFHSQFFTTALYPALWACWWVGRERSQPRGRNTGRGYWFRWVGVVVRIIPTVRSSPKVQSNFRKLQNKLNYVIVYVE